MLIIIFQFKFDIFREILIFVSFQCSELINCLTRDIYESHKKIETIETIRFK